MLRAILILIGAVFLIASPAASAASGSGVALPPDFTLTDGPCPYRGQGDAEGCAFPDGRIYVLPAAPNGTVWHEIGHVFDFQLLTGGDRAWFQRIFRVRGPWADLDGPDPTYYDGEPAAMPTEIFADVYAECALGHRPSHDDPGIGGTGFEPTRKNLRRMCAGIERIGRRKGARH